MKNKLLLILLLFSSYSGISQELTQKEYIVIMVDIERNDDLHPRDIFYWVAESDKLNNDYEFDFSPLFLNLFYPSNSYDDCCIGKKSLFYAFTSESKFEFTNEFEIQQKVFREFLKSNGKKIQTIRKKWNNKFKEKVTIYATPIKTELCNCKIKDDKHFESVFLPTSEFRLNSEFWKKEISQSLIIDYSDFNPKY